MNDWDTSVTVEVVFPLARMRDAVERFIFCSPIKNSLALEFMSLRNIANFSIIDFTQFLTYITGASAMDVLTVPSQIVTERRRENLASLVQTERSEDLFSAILSKRRRINMGKKGFLSESPSLLWRFLESNIANLNKESYLRSENFARQVLTNEERDEPMRTSIKILVYLAQDEAKVSSTMKKKHEELVYNSSNINEAADE
ncbi:hypothetical protein EAI_02742 [Harpegnathos saltator]|uniref:Uncharacterized protein n=1 Tax=Harpegnathos saltator TaxID=610380 RepID=E2B2J9_HARSA|nr:hypothetical protein EAI_02742 [Harpegnathos saltator]